MMLKFQTANVNDVQLHYAEAPGPGPALVILHGITGSHAEFLHLVPKLAGQAHLYIVDLRGHGLSSQPEEGYLVPDYATDVAAFLQEVVGDRLPVVLLGHSLGSLIAVWLAGSMPHLFRGIILVDLPIYLLQMSRFRASVFYPYMKELHRYLRHYHADGASLEKMVAYVGGAPADDKNTLLEVAGPEAIQERALQLHQVDPAVLEPLLACELLAGREPDELLVQVRSPVHVLAAQAALGGAMEAEDVERAITQMPHCSHAIIEGSGHDIHLAQPDAFVRELQGFLNAIDAQTSPQRRMLTPDSR